MRRPAIAKRYDGDLGSAEARHLGRLPGLTNRKPDADDRPPLELTPIGRLDAIPPRTPEERKRYGRKPDGVMHVVPERLRARVRESVRLAG